MKKIFLEFQKKKKKFNSERKLTVKREEANTHKPGRDSNV